MVDFIASVPESHLCVLCVLFHYQPRVFCQNQGYHFGVKNKVFCIAQKTIAHQRAEIIIYEINNSTQLSLIFLELYHFEVDQSDKTFLRRGRYAI